MTGEDVSEIFSTLLVLSLLSALAAMGLHALRITHTPFWTTTGGVDALTIAAFCAVRLAIP